MVATQQLNLAVSGAHVTDRRHPGERVREGVHALPTQRVELGTTRGEQLRELRPLCGTVWLRLIENLAGLREPAALPGWLATTTARACIEVYRRNKRQIPRDTLDVTVPDGGPGHEHRLLLEEQQDALRAAFARLGDRCRQLLQMLFAEPPVAYAQVSSSIGIPVGAIGPTRRRCLAKLRSDPVLLPFQPSGGDRP